MPRPAHFPPHLPDYTGNSFVNLIASLVEARGGAPRHPALLSLPVSELKAATNILFVIIDGLGDGYLQTHGAGGHLARHRRGAISALFPSTTASAQVRTHFGALDAAFGELLARLAGSDTLIVLTADHGFIDCPPEESVELPPALAALLRFPLCGERRVAFCHVREEKVFLDKAREFFGQRADVRPSAELRQEGWFGPGRAHARFAERIGDVALVMKGRGTVKDWVAGEPRHLHIGNHGGMSEDEMQIPLVVAKT